MSCRIQGMFCPSICLSFVRGPFLHGVGLAALASATWPGAPGLGGSGLGVLAWGPWPGGPGGSGGPGLGALAWGLRPLVSHL